MKIISQRVENREAGVGPPEREGYQLYIGKDGQIFRSLQRRQGKC